MVKSIENDIRHIRQYIADIVRFGQLSPEQIRAKDNILHRLVDIECQLQSIEMTLNGEYLP